MNPNEVPIPRRMRGLQKDKRGYPVPFNVMRDLTGRPLFTVNDSIKTLRILKEKRCAICGYRLDKPSWCVGGPLSAFHPDGGYADPPLHDACKSYALQVCPYLAVRHYDGRIDDATVNYDHFPSGVLLRDDTQIPERPPVFVAVASHAYTIAYRGLNLPVCVTPSRPYVAIEYWQHGKRLSNAEGEQLVTERYPGIPIPR